ncbi:T9SS type A sorting domain-containing protein [Flavobacterium daemonense]|uniref:T9SS type A sorting domain-containing protein n=1 Tax=Flavobacterium daemonense TaxID=1393049 RepID=UPI0013A60BB6|nr:T9SS type A sorting domain-containing protein [Flavobacterium daemonense]KAF2337064.1 T9SS type A sorting domain-containing protein [Flavobacterium daemonense]
MTKNYLLLLISCVFSSVNSQIINFPDAKFKAKLLEADVVNNIAKGNFGEKIKIDLNGDGNIDQSEAANVIYLDVSKSDIASLVGIKSFSNLLSLNCASNKISDLDISNMLSLGGVNCDENQITNINHSGASNLTGLSCMYNLLTNLDFSDFLYLGELQCDGNQFSTLEITAPLPRLYQLSCSFNLLTSINLSGLNPNEFHTLSCFLNTITSLDLSRFTKLENLYCGSNPLTNLKVTAYETLQKFSYSETGISNFDVTKFPNLLVLSCNKTETTVLDLTGLKKLKILECGQNYIEHLNLQETLDLEDLYCPYNKLISLDLSKLTKLQNLEVESSDIADSNFNDLVSLETAVIWNTYIKTIDLSKSPSLKSLTVFRNPLLETINVKNGSLESEFIIVENPKLTNVCADDDDITKIEDAFKEYGVTNYNVNSYCTFAPGGESFSIQGSNRNDLNNNGCDATDIPASFLKFRIEDVAKSGNFISNDLGKYDIKVAAGKYNVTPVFENPSYFSVSPASVQVEFPTVSSPYTQDFCIKAVGVHNDLEVTFLPIWPARPGFAAKYRIIYKNKGNTAQSGTIGLTFDDSVSDLTTASPAVSSTSLNKLMWNFTNLKPFEIREIVLNFRINPPTDSAGVTFGDILSYSATATSSATDETPLDNVSAFNQIVVGSYDPNDKTCLEGNVITPTLIGEYVHYMIRFENTGTYMAQNIVVKDLIDLSKFDISTLIPVSASHPYAMKISDGNKVEFIFENINLPFDNVNRNGYISFKIKTLPTLKPGDTFANEANIYFDYNYPILTNKASSTFKALGTQDFEFSQYFNIYPNPVKDVLNIDSKNVIQKQSIQIFDILGQMIISVLDPENASKIDVSRLQSGTYILKVKSDKGSSSFKFIKK